MRFCIKHTESQFPYYIYMHCLFISFWPLELIVVRGSAELTQFVVSGVFFRCIINPRGGNGISVLLFLFINILSLACFVSKNPGYCKYVDEQTAAKGCNHYIQTGRPIFCVWKVSCTCILITTSFVSSITRFVAEIS